MMIRPMQKRYSVDTMKKPVRKRTQDDRASVKVDRPEGGRAMMS